MKLNAAQNILLACGVSHVMITLGHKKEVNRSFTKKGPGRGHKQGKKENQDA